MYCGGPQDRRRDSLVYNTPGPTKERKRSSGNARHISDIYRTRAGKEGGKKMRDFKLEKRGGRRREEKGVGWWDERGK